MPDLQKFIGRFARTMIDCKDDGPDVRTVHAIEVHHLPLLLDEVAKAAAEETVVAMLQEDRSKMSLCECCEKRRAVVAVNFHKHELDGGAEIVLHLCHECQKSNWSRYETRPLPEVQVR